MPIGKVTARDFAAKLRVTAAVLRCGSQKDLAAAFRAADPNTAFDPARSYKWMQGRALPREARLYEEWARLLDAGRSADWLAGASLEDFVEVVAARHDVAPDTLRERAGLQDDHGTAAGDDVQDGFICGAYATFSPAQSPHYAGRIIRGSLIIRVAPRRRDELVATLTQRWAGQRAAAHGPARLFGHALCLQLEVPTTNVAPVFCGLFRPTPPASVLAGMMCGTTAIHPGGQPPYATRIVMVRVPVKAAELEASNRYLEPSAHAQLAGELGALGLPAGLAPELDARLLACLRDEKDWAGGSDRFPIEGYVALVETCDRLWMAVAARPPAQDASARSDRRGDGDPRVASAPHRS